MSRLDVKISYCEGGTADGAREVAAGGGGDKGDTSCAFVVVFTAAEDDVAFDVCGFTVTGIPHILDSVVLTGLSLDAGLLGLHIASFCSGVKDIDEEDEDDVLFV
jgi:hypothetical protein